MKTKLPLIFCLIPFFLFGQEELAIEWMNKNAIEIEDASANSIPYIFHQNEPLQFKNAKIFGFGEATHHTKEFFDLKAKFFKYLVEHHGVKAFIMEENFSAEEGINEWISGGKGNREEILLNFRHGLWRTVETLNLLQWMRNYNIDKPKNDQIRFYGMDMQVVDNINFQIRELVKNHNLPITESQLLIIDKCVATKIDYKNPKKEFADKNIPNLRGIKDQIKINSTNNFEFKNALRAMDYLIDYVLHLAEPTSVNRDLKMFERAKQIIDDETYNGKAFVWAHNDHINHLGRNSYGSDWKSTGYYLKKYYKNDFYSVGFNFGSGILLGASIDKKNKRAKWSYYELEKPHKKTYAKTLNKVNLEIFFIDMDTALNSDAKDFFNNTSKVLLAGGAGFNHKKPILLTKKYSEMYDGLIFIKKVTPSTTNWPKYLENSSN